MSADYKLTLPVLTVEIADPMARAVLEKTRAQIGLVPNLYAGMANAPGLLETYLDGHERFRWRSGFTPVEQEVIFLTISRGNVCDYCMAFHSMIADQMSKVPFEVTEAIRDGRRIPEPKLHALSVFTDMMRGSRGLPTRSEVGAFLEAGYTERHVLDIILALALKTLSDYSQHLLDTPLDGICASRAWQRAA